MDDITTTLSVSKKFHDWLKSKGSKDENYEDIIKRLLKPEFVKELDSDVGHSDPYSKPVKQSKGIKKNKWKSNTSTKNKPHKLHISNVQGKFNKQKLRKKTHRAKPAMVPKRQKKSPNISKKSGIKPKTAGIYQEFKQKIQKKLRFTARKQ